MLDHILLSSLPHQARLLDLCCGTGQFTHRVTEAGYRVTGVDASARMLRFARRNAPTAILHHADARDFSVRTKFDGIYSVFESLNHIPTLDGLAGVFGRVRKHLKPGALFCFDLNREPAFEEHWNENNCFVEDDLVCCLRSSYDPASRHGTCQITAFEKRAEWRRTDFVLSQTCHDLDAVVDLLESAGFSHISLMDARDAGMDAETGFGRVFLSAQAGTRPITTKQRAK